MKVIKSATVLASVFFAATVAAASPLKFAKADANGDGSVDAAEFAASGVKGRKMEKLDKNGDGTLDKKEYNVALEEDCE